MTTDPTTTRRAAIQTISAVAVGAASLLKAESSPLASNDSDHPWIDAHAHIWSTDLATHPLRNNQPVEALQPRSFTDEELMAIALPEGVGRVVLIQHHPYHGFDNSYLIDAWKKSPDRFRIVGQIDDTKPGVPDLMKRMKAQGVTGFRIGPRDDRPNWLDGDGMEQMWKTAVETRQNMCCLINPSNIVETGKWCQRFPDTPVVVDHFARIGGDGTIHDDDLNNLCKLAESPLVRVKLSAYYAFGKKQPPYDDLIPMIRRLFDTFGPDRLMWASDSPYQLGGKNSYAASIALIREKLDFLTADDRRKLLCSTAESTFFAV